MVDVRRIERRKTRKKARIQLSKIIFGAIFPLLSAMWSIECTCVRCSLIIVVAWRYFYASFVDHLVGP